ncbi:hypothetical protein IG631_23000 [Alternaria alternata]|nr:hypothetical protein IG631_23000 [Alternaria alternata]
MLTCEVDWLPLAYVDALLAVDAGQCATKSHGQLTFSHMIDATHGGGSISQFYGSVEPLRPIVQHSIDTRM